MIDLALPFERRVQALPRLGLGISTEYGAGAHGLDLAALRRSHPELLQFIELGADLERGFDADARAWIAAGWPLTYHFLDVNLEESESLCETWLSHTRERARAAGAAWLCGDAGLWHIGPRDRGHGTLLPPVLTADSARAMAENVRRAREQTGFEVLPENPPAHAFLGDLHLLEYFARVSDAADCGLLLDVAHLAIYQHASGCAWSDGLADFPFERVVEIHVAGATPFSHRGRRFFDDDHSPEPLPETWRILQYALPRARELRALVYEGERNSTAAVLPRLRRLRRLLPPGALPGAAASGVPARGAAQPPGHARCGARTHGCEGAARVDHRRLQRALFRMQLDPGFAALLVAAGPAAVPSADLGPAELALLAPLDLRALEADRDGRRQEQFLRNVAGEFPLSSAVLGRAALESFPRSAPFHAAVRQDRPLPLALAEHLRSAAAGAGPLAGALLELESCLARARRAPAPAPALPPAGHVALAPAALLLELPEGTHAAACALRRALDAGAALPRLDLPAAPARECLLVYAEPPAAPFALREVRVEPLPGPLAELLERCRAPQSAAALRDHARANGSEPDELEGTIASFCADGVLLGALG